MADRPCILIVDDNPDILTSISISLEQAGYRTVTAHDARSSLAILDDDSPVLAIIDYGLPDSNGVDLGTKMREHAAGKRTKLVLLTGNQNVDLEQTGFSSLFEFVLIKPVSVQTLVAKIQAVGIVPIA